MNTLPPWTEISIISAASLIHTYFITTKVKALTQRGSFQRGRVKEREMTKKIQRDRKRNCHKNSMRGNVDQVLHHEVCGVKRVFTFAICKAV